MSDTGKTTASHSSSPLSPPLCIFSFFPMPCFNDFFSFDTYRPSSDYSTVLLYASNYFTLTHFVSFRFTAAPLLYISVCCSLALCWSANMKKCRCFFILSLEKHLFFPRLPTPPPLTKSDISAPSCIYQL